MANPKSKDDANRYLTLRGDNFYYQRKVPSSARSYDKRGDKRTGVFRVSLKTSEKALARKKRDEMEAADEKLWASLLAGVDAGTAMQTYAAAVRLVEALGFGFKPAEELSRNASITDLIARVNAMGPAETAPVHVEKALLGNVSEPSVTLSVANKIYMEEIASDEIIGKSERQRRKWRNVKKRGVGLFIEIVGDLPIEEINRDHALTFWRHWQQKIAPTEKGSRSTHTASSGNRDISTMRTLYSAYFKHIGQHDRLNPFAGLSFKERGASKRKRPPFPVEHLTNVIMKPGALAGLNDQARAILLAEIETGCRPSELANITKDAIKLDHEFPHIVIQPRDDPDDPRELKSEQSERTIPLVGVALEVFKKFPNGFSRYREKEEALSAVINKYLRENKLMPSEKHTLYGLRHSLEDRMKEAGIDEELRRILMGHKINREEYGTGGSLKWRQAELQKIALPFDPAIVTQ